MTENNLVKRARDTASLFEDQFDADIILECVERIVELEEVVRLQSAILNSLGLEEGES